MFRPEFVTDNHLGFLASLDHHTVDNIFRAVPRILTQYPHWSAKQAQDALRYWAYHKEVLQAPLAQRAAL